MKKRYFNNFYKKTMDNEDKQTSKYKYKCIQCGNCCRAGFEIVLEQEDIERWIKSGKYNYHQYAQIDPKCISHTGLAGYHIEEVNLLEILKKRYEFAQFMK